ncbi:MAG: hypothetical protein AAFY60_12350, partial [Myxococcota bacterium]
ASISALGNIGPGLAQVGPTADWSHLPNTAKWVMSLLMMVGRLEVFSVLILLTPWVWKMAPVGGGANLGEPRADVA